MVKIRLALRGKKNNPTYRVIVIDSRKKRDGEYIEDLGYFNPQVKPAKFEINKERYEHWLKTGAIPSATVLSLVKGEYEFVPYDRTKKETTEETTENKNEGEIIKEDTEDKKAVESVEKVEEKSEAVEKTENEEDNKKTD